MSPGTHTYQLSLSRVRDYNYARQFILPGFQATNIVEAARKLVGLHSARLLTPFVMSHIRVNNSKTVNLREELLTSRNLIKLRCMRKTLHTVPLDIASVVHQATLKLRISDCLRSYKKYKLPEGLIEDLKNIVVALVRATPSSSNVILNHMTRCVNRTFKITDEKLQRDLARNVLKHMWEEGTLCYINTSKFPGSEERLYGYTLDIYPNLDLEACRPHEAQKLLIYYHIDRYGPVTEMDISWWSGLSISTVRRCISEIREDLVTVSVDGFCTTFYMTASSFHDFMQFKVDDTPWIALLAYEDSSLKGYFESRGRYISPEHYNTLFNQIGEARASIVLNGKVIGVWTWDKKNNKVTWNVFTVLHKGLINNLYQAVNQMELYLSAESVNKSNF